MILLWSVLVAVVLVETLALSFRLNFWRRRADAIERAAFTYAEAQDDHQLQQIVLSAAWNLLGLALYMAGVLFIFVCVLDEFPDVVNIRDEVFIWPASAAFIAYAWLRASWCDHRSRRQGQATDTPEPGNTSTPAAGGYNRIARWLHWMALEIGLVRRTSFELEKALFLRKAQQNPHIAKEAVYVMGLARSGTTIVLEILDKTGAFHSPTYRNMPFVLCPNLWHSTSRYGRMDAQLATRAHGDGMTVGFDSPESFEEVFWRTACAPTQGATLGYEAIDVEAMADFEAYRQLSVYSALAPGQANTLRYLSKNNNNLLRLEQLSAQDGAQLVIVVRDPLATAWSLYRQHQRFLQMQADDPFVRAYMRWLGHHEFGQGHKPLGMGAKHLQGLCPSQPDYWLAYWLGIHEHLWHTFQSLAVASRGRIHWVSHGRMCDQPEAELDALFGLLHIAQSAQPYASLLKPAATATALQQHFSANLIGSAQALHKQIMGAMRPLLSEK